MKTFGALLSSCFCAGALTICKAQEPPPPQKNVDVKSVPPIKEISPDVLRIGAVTLDKKAGTATFPAVTNMDSGVIEYLLVGEGGKSYESLFVTKAEPYHLHVAMLLLGAKGSAKETSPSENPPPEYLNAQYLKTAPELKGDKISISARWKSSGKETVSPVEDLLNNDLQKEPMRRGPWVYNGSMLSRGSFLAQDGRSIAALVTDPAALINNPRLGHDNNQIWSINSAKCPPLKSPVEITIKLESPAQ